MWGVMSFCNPCLFLIVLDDFPETLTAHTLAVHVHEQRRLRLVGDDPGPDVPYVVLKGLHRTVVQGDDALLVPLAARMKPAVRFTSVTFSPMSSDTRMPVAYSSSSMA